MNNITLKFNYETESTWFEETETKRIVQAVKSVYYLAKIMIRPVVESDARLSPRAVVGTVLEPFVARPRGLIDGVESHITRANVLAQVIIILFQTNVTRLFTCIQMKNYDG